MDMQMQAISVEADAAWRIDCQIIRRSIVSRWVSCGLRGRKSAGGGRQRRGADMTNAKLLSEEMIKSIASGNQRLRSIRLYERLQGNEK